MTIRNPSQLKALLKPGQRLLGLDLGSRTIGLALSDPTLTVASAFDTIERKTLIKDIGALIRIMRAHEVGGLLIGMPLQMDGSEGERAVVTRKFADDLLLRVDIEIAFWDERLSSAAVERMLIEEVDMSRKRRKQVIDKTAAAYILQGALDFMKNAERMAPVDNEAEAETVADGS